MCRCLCIRNYKKYVIIRCLPHITCSVWGEENSKPELENAERREKIMKKCSMAGKVWRGPTDYVKYGSKFVVLENSLQQLGVEASEKFGIERCPNSGFKFSSSIGSQHDSAVSKQPRIFSRQQITQVITTSK